MLNVFNRMPEEALTQASEFLYGVRGEECEPRMLPAFFMDGPGQGQKPLQAVGNGPGCGFCGIHHADMRRHQAMQERLKQRIVSAPENQSVCLAEAVSKGFTQVNARDLFGDRVLDPSFFHQRNQQRTSLLPRLDPPRL